MGLFDFFKKKKSAPEVDPAVLKEISAGELIALADTVNSNKRSLGIGISTITYARISHTQ